MTTGACLRAGWQALGRAFWPLVLGAGLFLAIDICAAAVRVSSRTRMAELNVAQQVGIFAFVLIVRYFVRCYFGAGYLVMQARTAQDEPVKLGLLSSRAEMVGSLMIAQFARGLVVVLVTLLGSLPPLGLMIYGQSRGWNPLIVLPAAVLVPLAYVFASANLALTDWFVSLRGLTPLAALAASWRHTRPHRRSIAALFLVTLAVELVAWVVGLLLFVVGILFTVSAARAYTDAAFTAAFHRLDLPELDKPLAKASGRAAKRRK